MLLSQETVKLGDTGYNRHFTLLSGSLRLIIVIAALLAALPALVKILAASPARAAIDAPACQPFTQVNDPGFGMLSGDNFNGEEGFELAVFNEQLYLGMEADGALGARLWRTRPGVWMPQSQADWEEVIADANGKPYGLEDPAETDHIDSLAEFNGYLYVSNANGNGTFVGTHIYRSATGDPGSWEDALAGIGKGFGDPNNINFKDMQVFQGQLCGGTQNVITGAQVWCTSDGTSWVQKNTSGFNNKNNYWVYSGYVYNGNLYFGVQNQGRSTSSSDDVAKLFRTSDISGKPAWSEVYTGEAGSIRVDILGDVAGFLYISVRSPQGVLIYRSPYGERNSWEQVNLPGMRNNAANANIPVDGAIQYGGLLYAAVGNSQTGFELWRTSGATQDGLVDWEQVDASGLGESQNVMAQLMTYHDQLFAWVTNYTSGQRVLRASCLEESTPPEPTATSTPPPTQQPTPTETALPSQEPTLTNTPLPSPTPTQAPTMTETPLPSSEPTENQPGSSTPDPTATSTQPAPPSHTPVPTSTTEPGLCPNAGEDCSSIELDSRLTNRFYLPVIFHLAP